MQIPYVNPFVLKFRSLRWHLLGRFQSTLTARTKQGVFSIDARDRVIGKLLYLRGQYELDDTRQALGFLRDRGLLPPPGRGTVLDIGANIGVISIGLLVHGEFARGVGVEPDPRNYALLARNIELNGLGDRYLGLNVAASTGPGTLSFELSKTNYGDHRVRLDGVERAVGPDRFGESERSVIRVKADRLDDLVAALPPEYANDIAVVWIDTQGHEAQVFQGGPNFFRRSIPVVAEIMPYGLVRSGTGVEEFCRMAATYWTHYWVARRGGRFISYPIDLLRTYCDEVGFDGDYDNVILTR